MTRATKTRERLAACVTVLLVCACVCAAQERSPSEPAAASPIPENKIAALQVKLAQVGKQTSTIRRRMACKSVMREGEGLLEAYPSAPNRYAVLGVIFQSQKQLLGLESSGRNREALFETCEKLAQAPDEYAELRLEADLLLSDRDLSAKGATSEERAKALEAIVKRYRGTPAEAKSLMIASLIAPKLKAFDLQQRLFDAMSERFGGDPRVIEFIQRNLGVRRLDVLFNGTFRRDDGTAIHFPNDRLGHLSIMVFWSRQAPGFKEYLLQIKQYQDQYPDRFDVFSFNLDELPDAGKATLRELELDWTVMRLPGGKNSQTFRTYAQKDPLGILVNAYGHAILAPAVVRETKFNLPDARISDDRYLTQLQSLFIGDFLVTDADGSFDPAMPAELKMIPMVADALTPAGLKRTVESVPKDTLGTIQACFIPPPFRYRLTLAEALANYTKAEKLCRDAIKHHPKAPDLWLVRNRKIIASLGMWNLTNEPKYLEQAVREAHASLAEKLPPGAGVVPRFCLAKEALRQGDSNPSAVLSALIEETGGDHAPCSAVAAAAILALDANSRELHERYRKILLNTGDSGNPMLWSVVSFLRDRYCRYHLFKGNFIRFEDPHPTRSYIVANGPPATTERLVKLELKNLDGRPLILPKDTEGKLTILLFVEPPVDKTQTKLPGQVMNVMGYAKEMSDCYVHKEELIVIAAFLCDDAKRIDGVMKANGLTCRAAMVPGGLANPLVRRLGIFSADRIPNVLLLHRDGTIVWRTSGFNYKADYGYPFAVRLAMKVHLEICDLETAYEALKQGDYQQALHYFADPYVPDNDQRYIWAGPRLHGRALAHMGLKQWDKALADIDAAIEAHSKWNGRPRRGPPRIVITPEMRLVRATILDRLGRKQEADAERKNAAVPDSAHHATPYGLFHARLQALQLNQNQEMEKK